jgi:hypothetical protein
MLMLVFKDDTRHVNVIETLTVASALLPRTAFPLMPSHCYARYFGIPFSVDMGFAYGNRTEESWSEGNYYGCSPLPLMCTVLGF